MARKYGKYSNISDYAKYIVDRHFNAAVLLNAYIEKPDQCEAFIRYCIANGLDASNLISHIPHATGVIEQSGYAGNLYAGLSVDFTGARSNALIAGDMRQSTVSYQQKLLKCINGERYYWSSGIGINNCSTPDSLNNTFSNEIEVTAKFTYIADNTFPILVDKTVTGSQYYLGYSQGLGIFRFYSSGVGTIDSSSVTLIDNQVYWFKFNWSNSANTYHFYLSTDGINYEDVGHGSASGTMSGSASVLQIGGEGSSSYLWKGNIYYLRISPTIGGTPTVNFDFTNYNPAVSETIWTSSTGETWTLNRPLDSNFQSTIVTRTCIQHKQGTWLDSGVFSVDITNGFTRFAIVNPLSSNGNRGSWMGDPTPYYILQSMLWDDVDNTIYGDSVSTYTNPHIPKYLVDVLPNITQILSERKKHSTILELQTNKGVNFTGGSAGVITNYIGEQINVQAAGGGFSAVGNGYVSFSKLLSPTEKVAMQDFINQTLFNSELF